MALVQDQLITDAMVAGGGTPRDWLVIAPLVIPLFAGAILLMLRGQPRLQSVIAPIGLALALVANIALFLDVIASGPKVMMMGAWKAPFGIAFVADRLGTLFSTTGALVTLLVMAGTLRDVNADERRYGFYPFVMLLLSGVTGAFLTGDLFNLYVWFEVLLIASFGLLVLGSERAQIDGAVKYGLLNLIATTLFLIATGLVYAILGTLNMADIAQKSRAIGADGPLVAVTALLALAFAGKAAAFPLNFWLPASYHTPPAAISALFAALLTKVGVYALLKSLVLLFPVQSAVFGEVAVFIAGSTMILGAFGALAQASLRPLIGWLLISGVGAMLIGPAVQSEEAVSASVFYAVHSMLVMAALYLIAGEIEAITGSGQLARLGGLMRRAPWLSAAFFVAILAVAGLPPLTGFWAKAMLFKASLSSGHPGLAVVLFLSAFIAMIAIFRVFLYAVWRDGPEFAPDGDGDPKLLTRVQVRPMAFAAIAALLGLVIVLGLWPGPLYDSARAAAADIRDPVHNFKAVFGGMP